MIDHEFDAVSRILRVRPESSLDENDFKELAKAVDPEISANGDLAGLIIEAPHFPGWNGLGAAMTHLKFVHDHHQHVKKIAVVTDSHLGDFAEHLVSHFISAEIQQFPAGQIEQAQHWIRGEGKPPTGDTVPNQPMAVANTLPTP